jgi:DNA-binding PadR family transcriptional regulator
LNNTKSSSIVFVTKALNKIVKVLPDVFILHTISAGPKTGYDIQKYLSRIFGFKVSYGTLYPHLHNLETSDLVRGYWIQCIKNKKMQKKEYHITELGRKMIEANSEVFNKLALTLKIGVGGDIIRPDNRIIHTPTMELVDYLKKDGFTAKDGIKMRGLSGIEQEIDIFASRHRKGQEERIIFGLYESEIEVMMDEVLKFYLKGNDINAHKFFLLVCPKLSEKAEKIASLCQIKVIKAEEMEKAIQQTINDLKKLN